MMDQLIDSFPQQIKEALEISRSLDLTTGNVEVHEVVIAGMGGSGIGGDFVQQILSDECHVPVFVIKGYDLPAFADKNTLIIVSSYSGKTEESVSVLHKAMISSCQIVCLSSGGKVEEEAVKNKLPFVKIPVGYSSPRACLGYSVVLQLAILQQYGFVKSGMMDGFMVASDLIKFEKDEIKNKAKNIAEQLIGKIVVIYSTGTFEPNAVRLRQQLNENAKMLCWHHTFPEMNHNELVGWADKSPLAVLFLRNKDDFRKNAKRMDITKEIIQDKTNTLIELYSKGQSRIEKMIYLIHICDWISFYVAKSRNVDPVEIRVIEFLKSSLEKDNIV
ncbi:MAG: bifunctional phosphoglucose/phosphomannose isomerase [Saprospiraceae bacterium]|nr:bifunctional phosphoglucose/phosphomannose isomerase [Saprospiraceae bacterium]